MHPKHILCFSRDDSVRRNVTALLAGEGYQLSHFKRFGEHRISLKSADAPFDLALWDIDKADTDQFHNFSEASSLLSETPVIVLTGIENINFALELMRAGAFDCVIKPLEREQLLASVCRALQYVSRPAVPGVLRTTLASMDQIARTPEATGLSRILIVDDEDRIREIVTSMLQSANYRCAQAASGFEALALLDSEGPFDLMLSDLMMTGMDGIGLLEIAHKQYPEMLTVIVTAVHDISVAREAIRNGAYDYLLKPFEREQLLAIVRRALSYQHVKRENQRYRELLDRLGHPSDHINQPMRVPAASTIHPKLDKLSLHRTVPENERQNTAVLSILHDLSNEVMAMSARVELFAHQPGLSVDAVKESAEVGRQASRSSASLQLILSHLDLRQNTLTAEVQPNDQADNLQRARHDLSGDLFVIGNGLAKLRDFCKTSPVQIADLQTLNKSIQRCSELLQQINFEGQNCGGLMGDQAEVDVDTLVEKASVIVSTRLQPNIRFVIECSPDCGSLRPAFPVDRLISILIELITNSINALQPLGGTITLFVNKTTDMIEFVIVDDGPGVPANVVEKRARPRSIKHTGRGLGLYLSKKMVFQHGGTFTLVSGAPGQGTRITLLLPLRKGPQ